MVVYKRGPLGLDLPPLDGLLLPMVVLLILAVLFLAWPSTQPNALSARTLENPLFLSLNDSTILQVMVGNPTNESVSGIVVSAAAVGSNLLSVYPNTQTIPSLGPQESRILEFLVTPIDQSSAPFLPGTYRIDVKTKIANVPYQTSVAVNVQK